jgi:WD40 repeat protein
MDQTVAIWDTNRSGLCLSRLTYHEGAVKDVKWSPCGAQVLSCGYDKSARLVDIETGND